jgi:phosphoribosyl-dephospho-CoA transferase
VAAWLAQGRPAVAARRPAGADEALACLGIPLPPSRGRARIPLRAPLQAVVRVGPPLALAEAIPSAPAGQREALRGLHAEAVTLGLLLRVHGSLPWQHLTGEPYLTASSDLDLLLSIGSRWQLSAALRLLALWERRTGLVVDGELRLPAGGVAWRELATGAERLLVKRAAGVDLLSRHELLGALPSGMAP